MGCKLLVLLMFFCSFTSYAGVDEFCLEVNGCGANLKHGSESNYYLNHLGGDIENIRHKLSVLNKDVNLEIHTFEIKLERIKILEGEIQDLKDTLWNVFHWIIGMFGLATLLGIIFTVKEYVVSSKAWDLEEKQLNSKKVEVDKKITESMNEMDRRMSSELDLFRKKMLIQEILATKDVDEDGLYDAIRVMDRDPKVKYIPIYQKLLGLSLTEELQFEIERALENAKAIY